MRTPRITTALIATVALSSAACGGTEAATPVPAVTVTVTETATPSENAAENTFALAEAGLTVTVDGTVHDLPYGTARAEVDALVEQVLGAPTDEFFSEECPAGPATQVGYVGGLELVHQDGAFAGWGLDAGTNAAFMTPAGVGIGTSRADVEAAYPGVDIFESTLGTEFFTGEVAGVFDADADGDPVFVMWSGVACVYR